jgi:transcriptional/translational regulatory protein YebC/TACO1
VAYLFEKKGYLLAAGEEDAVLLAALDAGAEDVRPSAEQWEVLTAPADLSRVRRSLEEAGVAVESAEVTYIPSTLLPLGEEAARRVLRLVDLLEELDDVQAVYGNFDISDEVMAAVAG